jgi:DNA mismatch repair protein MutS2
MSFAEKYIRLLEFDRVMQRAAEFSKSEEAYADMMKQVPLQDDAQLEVLKSAVLSIKNRIDAQALEPRGDLPSVGEILTRLDIAGMVLELEEIYALARFITEGNALVKWLSPDEFLNQTLLVLLPDCHVIAQKIFSVLDKTGQLRDLPVFVTIKKAIALLERESRAITASYAEHDPAVLQSALPSIRDGRTVIAVKARFRSRIRGIVHEISATGQTLFLEPEEIVEKNNEITILQQKLAIEIRRVLRELTEFIAEQKQTLVLFHSKIIYIESLRARAHYACRTKGVFAQTTRRLQEEHGADGDGTAGGAFLKLIQVKHPLLGEAAVPLDIEIKKDRYALIISGPNTGGKTLALKTIGLCALMNQSGLAIPAVEGSALPVFDGVYADIGDEQSIGSALSTFSAHIKNIAEILNLASSRSLVLLDELGSGTEASEGSSLAMAIADEFIEKRTMLCITSHLSPFKQYGWTRRFAENAAMDFDADSLRPNYRLIMGSSGESRALDIAGRHGLPVNIIDNARRYMSEGAGDTSKLIHELQEKYRLVEQEKEDLKQKQLSLLEQQKKHDARELSLRQREAAIKSCELRDLHSLLSEWRKKLENLVREIREGELNREKTVRVKEVLHELSETIKGEDAKALTEGEETALFERNLHMAGDEHGSGLAASDGQSHGSKKPLTKGMSVFAGKDKRRGIVKRAGKKGCWIVEIGSVCVPFAEDELLPLNERPVFKASVSALECSMPAAAFELDLRGLRLEEALEVLSHQLDAAMVSNLKSFALIHGKGDGILSRGAHEFLKNHPAVADYYFSRPEEGGAGKTEVALK